MSSEWKSNAAVLEDWEDEAEDWLPAHLERNHAEGVLIDTLAEALQERFPDRELPEFDLSRREPNETQAEFQLRELKQFFNEAVAAIADSDLARRFLQQEMTSSLTHAAMAGLADHDPDQVHALDSEFTQARRQLRHYLENDLVDALATPLVLRDFNNFAQNNPESPVHDLRDDRSANYGAEWKYDLRTNSEEAYLLDRLTTAFQERWPEAKAPELDPADRREEESPAEFQLRKIKEAMTAVVAAESEKDENPAAFLDNRTAAAYALAQAALEPDRRDQWQDPEKYLKYAAILLAQYLDSEPEGPNWNERAVCEYALTALHNAAVQDPAAFGLKNREDWHNPESQAEAAAANYREPSPEAALKLAEFAGKLLDFCHDPEAVYERRRVHDYVRDTFTQDRPETLLLKALDIANNEMTFTSLEERREFADHAAAALIDQLLGGSAEARKLVAGSLYQLEPGGEDPYVKQAQESYAQAEASFKKLLTDQLATYCPAWTQHIPEEEVPQRYAYIIKTLQGQLEASPDQDPADFLSPAEAAEKLKFQQEHFSPYIEARASNQYGGALPHIQHEALPEFTMARYLEPPWYLRNADEARIEKWQKYDSGLLNQEPEDRALLQETLQALAERYPGTAMHKDELPNNFPNQCMDDLKQVFHNQSFASAEHRRQEAAAVAAAIIPADDPLLREWNQEGWQASAEGNRQLQEFLNDDRHGLNSYHRVVHYTALARQARQETQDFLRELAAVPA